VKKATFLRFRGGNWGDRPNLDPPLVSCGAMMCRWSVAKE